MRWVVAALFIVLLIYWTVFTNGRNGYINSAIGALSAACIAYLYVKDIRHHRNKK
jgi:multisubunit Na+/H+ antiporter MnhE subunit